MKKILLLILAITMLLGTLAGCNGGKGNGVETTAAPVETDAPYELTVVDMENEEMVILAPYGKIWQFEEWSYNSDNLNLAILRRNDRVEDTLNCDIKMSWVHGSGSSVASAMDELLTQEMLGQTGAYDMVFAEYWWNLEAKGYFENLIDSELSPVIALDQPFFCQGWNDVATINNTLVSAMGYGSVEMMARVTVTYFNKPWYESLFDGNVYDFITNGQWTLETMEAMSKIAESDLNEDGMDVEQGDKFGFLCPLQSGRALFYSMGGRFWQKNADGAWTYDYLSDANVQRFDALYDFINDNEYLTNEDYTVQAKWFADNQVLFFLSELSLGTTIKKTGDVKYGLLPFPKFNTDQTDYISTLSNAASYSIPTTADSKVNSGIFLNAYNYFAYDTIRPAYYEQVLKLENVQDPESAGVIDLVMNSIYLDFGFIYNANLGTINNIYYDTLIRQGKRQFQSEYYKKLETLDQDLADFIAAYTRMNG